MNAAIPKAFLIAAGAGALGGCASYARERPKLAYFIVPCNTPGAFSAQPVNTADDIPAATPQDLLPETMKVAPADEPKGAATCLIAAANGTPTWVPAYSGYGYARYYPYSRHQHGGIGIVPHGGGHHSGRHGGGHGRH